MSRLIDYIKAHSRAQDQDGDGADLIFFKVKATTEATVDEFADTIFSFKGEFCDLNPLLDNQEYNYIQIGQWLGSQELALRFMGLGAELGMWKLLTPRTMLPGLLTDEQVQKLAGMGMVSIQVSKR